MGPSLLVAFMAGCGNVLLTNPIWTVATRMQALPCPRRAFLLQLFLCGYITVFLPLLPSARRPLP